MRDDSEQLKPCPFCGESPHGVDFIGTKDRWVGCNNEDCAMNHQFPDEESAINAWNTRHVSSCSNDGLLELIELEKHLTERIDYRSNKTATQGQRKSIRIECVCYGNIRAAVRRSIEKLQRRQPIDSRSFSGVKTSIQIAFAKLNQRFRNVDDQQAIQDCYNTVFCGLDTIDPGTSKAIKVNQ